MTPVVMTVLGPVAGTALGVTMPHEHVLCDLWRVTRDPRHYMVDGPLAVEEVGRFRAAGGGTLVDCTTRQFGRDPMGLRTVARATGVHIVMGCGWYREPFYDRSIYEGSVADIAAAIEREILDGVDGTGIQPGIIGEIGTDLHYISPAEERVFRAVARVQKRTGLSVTTHTARCPVGLAQLDLLAEEGVDLRRSSSVTATRTRTRSFTRRSPDGERTSSSTTCAATRSGTRGTRSSGSGVSWTRGMRTKCCSHRTCT